MVMKKKKTAKKATQKKVVKKKATKRKPAKKKPVRKSKDKSIQARKNVKSPTAGDKSGQVPLSSRQKKIRALIVKRDGNITNHDICREIGIGVTTLWLELQAIRKYKPIDGGTTKSEAQEILDSIAWHGGMIKTLEAELVKMDDPSIPAETARDVVGYSKAKAGMYAQLQVAIANRQKFLHDIGMVTRIPEELIVKTMGINDADTDEKIIDRKKKLRNQIAALEALAK